MAEISTIQPPRDREAIPRVLLAAVGGLVLLTLAMTGFARITGMEPAAMPRDSVGVEREASIVITGALGGGATITDPEGRLILEMNTLEAGFVNGVQRALARTRMKAGADQTAPVRLVAFSDGRLGLRDDVTGWRAELIGFGDDNAAAFAKILAAAP